MRRAALVALAALLSGCATGEARPLRESEVRAAGAELAKALDGLGQGGLGQGGLALERVPVLRVVVGAPDALVEEARRRAVECGKFTVSDAKDRRPDFALDTSVVEGRDSAGPIVTVTFEVIELATHRRVLSATWSGVK